MIPKRLEDDLNSIPRYKIERDRERLDINKLLTQSEESQLFNQVFGFKSSGSSATSASSSTSSSAFSSIPRHPPLDEHIRPISGEREREKDEKNSKTEFTTLLSSRLVTIEKENKELRRTIASTNLKIITLEEEKKTLLELVSQRERGGERGGERGENISFENYQKMKLENKQLRYQIIEMENFLSDYGLVWVGNSQDSKEHSSKDLKDTKDTKEGREEEQLNYDQFIQKITELNSLILSEPTEVMTTVSQGNRIRARLVHAEDRFETIPLTLYSNGLLIKRGPFRPQGSESFQRFVRDILDGYFPSDFQEEYPNGVIFKLIDKRSDIFQEKDRERGSSLGSGSGLGEREKEENGMKIGQFLNRLPKTIVKDGNILSIRDDIAQKYHLNDNSSSLPSSSSSLPISTSSSSSVPTSESQGKSQIKTLYSVVQRSIELEEELYDEITTIQIKWNNRLNSLGNQTFLLKMYASDTVRDVRDVLVEEIIKQEREGKKNGEKEREEERMKEIESRLRLRSSHPSRLLNDKETMRECGLVPNGTIHIEIN